MRSISLFLKTLILSVAVWLPCHSFAQIFEPFQGRYIYLPGSEVVNPDDQAFNNTQRDPLHILETVVRFPVKFGNSGSFIVPDLTYKRYFQRFDQWPQSYPQPSNADHFRLVLKGIVKVNEAWDILLLGGIAQGLDGGAAATWDNNYYRFGGGFLKDLKNGNQFGIALQWVSEARIVVPIPVFKGSSQNNKWQYDVEGPRAVVEYNLNDNNRIRLEQKFDNDRITYSENNEGGQNNIETYNHTHLNYALGWSRRIKGPVFFNLSGGLSPLFLTTLYDGEEVSIETVRFSWEPAFSASIYVSVNPKDYID
ncbi:MAG: hypothetical protein AAFX87_30855 [Bacteroidota bacterium]